MSTAKTRGSAATQSDLWGERARDWAEVLEGWNGWGIPAYQYILERVPVGRGTKLLDMGCGAGRFCRIAADRGAEIAGIDATAAFVEVARQRVASGDFRVGDIEDLPWSDDSFDVVTGFNSFIFAADIVHALREAKRVARPGATVAITAFGRPERCESTLVFGSVGQLLPAQPEAEGGGPALHAEGDAGDVGERGRADAEGRGLFRTCGGVPGPGHFPARIPGCRPDRPRCPVARGASRSRGAHGGCVLAEDSSRGVRFEDELRYLIATA
jgi:SAM-dependent methyltransferase